MEGSSRRRRRRNEESWRGCEAERNFGRRNAYYWERRKLRRK